nr:hypothetical protein [Tanacetum cinerariifolium]
GNFLDKMPRECLKIIESKSKVHQTQAKAVIAKVGTSSSTPAISSDVTELKDMVKALLLDKKNQSPAPTPSTTPVPVKAVESSCVTCGGAHSYQNYPTTQENAYRDNIQEYVSQAAAANYNQGNTDFRPQMVANQIRPPSFPPHQNNQNNFNQGNNFNQNQGGNFTILTQLLSIKANSIDLRSGTLPGNIITNPKEDLKGITTRSGVAYPRPKSPSPSKQGTKVTKDQVQTTSSQSTAPVQPSVIQSESQDPVSKPVVAPVSAPMPNLKPSIHYPSRRDNEKRPLIGNKEKLSEMARTTMNEHCSAVILNKLPRKLGDPGKFLIPCEFSGMDEYLALADLGASINLMPLSVWEGLSLPELTPTCMTLELVDRLVSKPIGIAKDVSFKVGVFHFPADFVVVDFEPDPRVPLILGRCFLKTSRALIDVHKGELTLRIGNEAITYNLDQTVELKDLPHHLEYAYLKGDNKLPVIIAKEMGSEEKAALIKVLKSHKRAITWKLSDIQGINPEFCTHKILMEEDYKPAMQHKRRVNPKIHDVIKKEVEKLLDAGLIYPISDSPWVSPTASPGTFKFPLTLVIKKRQHSPAHMALFPTVACLSACAMLRALFKG